MPLLVKCRSLVVTALLAQLLLMQCLAQDAEGENQIEALPMVRPYEQQKQNTSTTNRSTGTVAPADIVTPDAQRNLQLGIFYTCVALLLIGVILGIIRIVAESREIQLYAERKGSRSSNQIRSGSSQGSKEKNSGGTPSQTTPQGGSGMIVQPSSQILTSIAPTPSSPSVPMTPMTARS